MRSDDPSPERDPAEDARFDELIDPAFNPITGSTGYAPQFFGYPPQESSQTPLRSPDEPPPSLDKLRKPMSFGEKLGCFLSAMTIAALVVARAFDVFG